MRIVHVKNVPSASDFLKNYILLCVCMCLCVCVCVGMIVCDSLKENGPKGRGTIRRCGFVEVGVALLEVVFRCGGRL